MICQEMHWTMEAWDELAPEERAAWFAFFEVKQWREEREKKLAEAAAGL